MFKLWVITILYKNGALVLHNKEGQSAFTDKNEAEAEFETLVLGTNMVEAELHELASAKTIRKKDNKREAANAIITAAIAEGIDGL